MTEHEPTAQQDLALALELADLADAESVSAFERLASRRYSLKDDGSPVTQTDLAIERTLREYLTRKRPDDLISGEELDSSSVSQGDREWLIDPLDATKNFLRGNPLFATMIAFLKGGVPVVGVVTAPAFSWRWSAVKGDGAFWNGTRISVSDVESLDEAVLSYTNYLSSFERRGFGENFLALARRCWIARGFGNFWQHMLVAQGAVDVALEVGVERWDTAAAQVIVEEAGGIISPLLDHDGLVIPKSVISSNNNLHSIALSAFARPEE